MNRLKECRRAAGMKQETVAKTIGVSQSTYSQYELGNREPSNDAMIKLAKMFNTSVDYLMGRPISDIQKISDRFEGMDTEEILETLATRDEMRVLFSLTKDAPRDDIIRTIAIIEALKEKSEI